MILLGITGTDGAGKGEVVNYLVNEKGYAHYSSRASIVKEIEVRGLPVDRNQMRLVANDMRREFGNDILVVRALERIETSGTAYNVVESIRATAEADTLRAAGGLLIAVDAEQDIRYARVQERRSASDKVSFEQFKEHEALEMNDPDPHGMQKQRVIEMADYVITNNGALEDLRVQIEKVLAQIAE